MRLILVRHGETERNRDKNSPHKSLNGLNATGRKQADAVAMRLKEMPVDIIISSNFQRAKETADIIAQYHPGADRIIDPEVRERDSGEFTSKTVAEREAAEHASGLSFRDWRPVGGESLRDVKIRAQAWYKKNMQPTSALSSLVVSHGFFLYTLLEVAVENGADTEREEFAMSNGGFTVLDIHPEHGTQVIHMNETGHLKEIGTLPSAIGSRVRPNNKS